MIITWIIGLILSILGIYLLKISRTRAITRYGSVVKGEEPILKVWNLIILLLCAIMPIFNIFVGAIVITYWSISIYSDEDWKCINPFPDKVKQFLNKPI